MRLVIVRGGILGEISSDLDERHLDGVLEDSLDSIEGSFTTEALFDVCDGCAGSASLLKVLLPAPISEFMKHKGHCKDEHSTG